MNKGTPSLCDSCSFDEQDQFLKLHERRDYALCGQQGKSEGFDSCNQPSNLKLGSNR